MSCGMRIGHGYDVHRYDSERKLILGGVEVPFEMGLLGHSDADVLCHALMDALLGAMCLGDIGKHFPDSDERYKGISSLELLRHVKGLMDEKGFELVNADVTVIAQKPKLAPFIPQMVENLCKILECPNINIKATTEERLGFTGRLEGVSSHAVALLNLK